MVLDLNSSLFPLNYRQKYPITRGIRVEIAAIIIISLTGIMSQLKVWKIVKQKREERASEQRQKERERDLSDEEQGRKVEADNLQDRPLWEASHDNQNKSKVQEAFLDSGVGTDEPSSTRKSSWGDLGKSDTEGMELQNLSGDRKGIKDGGRVTVHVAQDDFYETALIGGQRTSIERSMLESAAGPSTQPASETSSTKKTVQSTIKVIDPSLTLQPKVVPPPFKIPDLDSASDDDGSSIEASAPTEHLPTREFNRYSGSSVMRKISQRSYNAGSTSEEALMIPHIEEDRASSVAANQDEISEKGSSTEMLDYSRSHTPVIETVLDHESLDALVATDHGRVPNPDVAATQLPESIALPSSRPASINLDGQSKEVDANGALQSKLSAPSTDRAQLAGNLPNGESKVVTAYRTNEWAKHLEGADIPDANGFKIEKRQAPNESQQGERVAPLDILALQQTPLNAEPGPSVTNSKQVSSESSLPSKSLASHLISRNPFSRHSKSKNHEIKSQPILHPLTTARPNEANPSQISLATSASRTSSQTSLNSIGSQGNNHRPPLPKLRSSQISLSHKGGHRNSSSPLVTTPVVESPIEEGVELSFPNPRFKPHNAHLMSRRDRIVTSKPSSTSLLRTSYSNVALDQHPAYRSAEEDNDDIPLAKRKSILQQNPHGTPLAHRSSSGPSGVTTPRLSTGASTPLQNNPYRSSSNPQLVRPQPTQRDSTISAWHNSLKPNTTAHLENQNMEARRAELMREKQRESTSRLEGQIKQGVRTSVIDQGMRRGDMMSAHQAAMRKLQGEAKI